MRDFNEEGFVSWLGTGAIITILILLALMAFTSGCCSAKCQKVVYQPVEVKVPVPVEGPVLPLPEPPDCGTAPTEWREAALYLKTCYDRLWLNIEELRHIISSYNETRVKPD